MLTAKQLQQRSERMRLLNLGKPAPSRLSYGEAARNSIISDYKRKAKQRGLLFELSLDDCLELFQGKCFYCGTEPRSVAKSKVFYGEYKYNGIDRLKNTEGYKKNNVVSCCMLCNLKKGTLDIDVFLSHLLKIYNHVSRTD